MRKLVSTSKPRTSTFKPPPRRTPSNSEVAPLPAAPPQASSAGARASDKSARATTYLNVLTVIINFGILLSAFLIARPQVSIDWRDTTIDSVNEAACILEDGSLQLTFESADTYAIANNGFYEIQYVGAGSRTRDLNMQPAFEGVTAASSVWPLHTREALLSWLATDPNDPDATWPEVIAPMDTFLTSEDVPIPAGQQRKVILRRTWTFRIDNTAAVSEALDAISSAQFQDDLVFMFTRNIEKPQLQTLWNVWISEDEFRELLKSQPPSCN